MTETDALLLHLAEECLEVAHECHKAVRFGLNDKWKDGPTPHAKIQNELNDVFGVLRTLKELGLTFHHSETAINEKMVKIQRFLQYSKDRKKLTD